MPQSLNKILALAESPQRKKTPGNKEHLSNAYRERTKGGGGTPKNQTVITTLKKQGMGASTACLLTNLARKRRYDMDCHFLCDVPSVPVPLSSHL